MKIKAILPWPPSVNHYFIERAVRGRVMKCVGKKGKEYRSNVARLFRQAFGGEREPAKELVSLEIGAIVPDRRKRDIDNIQKALLDALDDAGLFEDDSQIVEVKIRKYPKDERLPDGGVLVQACTCDQPVYSSWENNVLEGVA